MDHPSAPDEGVREAEPLPPRRETVLARYSRRSKLTALGLVFVVLIALSYVSAQMLSNDTAPKAGQHGPKVHSADAIDKTSVVSAQERDGQAGDMRTASDPNGARLNEQDDKSVKMIAAPDAELTEDTSEGSLPRIAEDGRQPWQVYARPFNVADKRPRLALVVTDLGLSRSVTELAVTRLPAAVTLAFDVQGAVTASWCGRARQDGHEIFLSLPMEPFDYPRSDPGAHALLTTLPNSANLERLNWALRQGVGYVGVTTLSGSRFTTDSEKMRLVLDTLKQRGLMILDAHVAPHSSVTELARAEHVPVAMATAKIDDNLSPEEIDNVLSQLEQVARLNGHAVGIVPALPLVIERLQVWLNNLPEHGIALAPVSSLAQ